MGVLFKLCCLVCIAATLHRAFTDSGVVHHGSLKASAENRSGALTAGAGLL